MDGNNAAVWILCNVLFVTFKVASGVDIEGFQSRSDCAGSGFSFSNIDPHHCASFSSEVGSIVFSGLGACQLAMVFRQGSCDDKVGIHAGDACFTGGLFTGAKYVDACRRRSLLSDSTNNKPCVEARPDGIVYTEDYKQGTWVLRTNDATDLFPHFASIADAGKTHWLRSQGAFYRKSATVGTRTVREVSV